MDRVPPEVLHLICSYFSPSEARSLRLCCKTFADIGACYGFGTITFYLCRADFKKLHAIAQHPIISKHVKSLIYNAAMLEEPAKTLEQYIDKTRSVVYRRQVEMCDKNWLPDSALLQEPYDRYSCAPISAGDIQENYSHYMSMIRDQRRILSTKQDFLLLKEAIPKLTNLQSIMLTNGDWYLDPTNIPSPFDAFFCYSLYSHEPHGVRQMEAIFHGLADSGIQLHSLYAGTLDICLIRPTFFDQILATCSHLKSIDLAFDTIDPEVTLGADETRLIVAARESTDTGIIATFLRKLPDLVKLSIGFTAAEDMGMTYPASLSNIISPGFKWRQLHHLSLAAVETERHELLAFFILHQPTLKTVFMRDCRLISTSWTRLLKQMKWILKLKDIRLSGRIQGKVEVEDDYSVPTVVGETEECWWLGDPEIDHEPVLPAKLSAWFLHDDEPYPLTHYQMHIGSSVDFDLAD
ncbi:hypothetical protein F4779DRAFT_602821 [Xylariaceae sp. FL0662B]|nr:hypothetical protein F4779DRAFT_602821 [Xylariaceae sp. FL0662B]